MKRVQLACEHEREVAKAGEGVAAVPAWEGAPAVLEKPVVGLGAGVDCYVLVLGGAKGLERRKGEERTVSFGYGGMFVFVRFVFLFFCACCEGLALALAGTYRHASFNQIRTRMSDGVFDGLCEEACYYGA